MPGILPGFFYTSTFNMPKPSPEYYPPYFQKYIDLVPDENLLTGFINQTPAIQTLLHGITEDKATYSYAPGKWTLKDLLQHIIDTERIFAYRAVCFARLETTPLPGFDENTYAANANAGLRSWQNLSEEFLAVRTSTNLLFKNFTKNELDRTGVANNIVTSVASMGFITLGHVYHHIKIVEERYLM